MYLPRPSANDAVPVSNIVLSVSAFPQSRGKRFTIIFAMPRFQPALMSQAFSASPPKPLWRQWTIERCRGSILALDFRGFYGPSSADKPVDLRLS